MGEFGRPPGRLIKGYHNRPDATADAVWLAGDGRTFLKTGDIGKLDEDGYLYISTGKKSASTNGWPGWRSEAASPATRWARFSRRNCEWNMAAESIHGAFSVSVSKDYLTFSAAHFLTIPGHKCESLHGHNYVVTVVVEGAVDRLTGFVVDFAVVKTVLRPVIDGIDHRVLVPTMNPAVRIASEADATVVQYRGERRFVFPTAHVALVPVSDTTAELLAEFLAHAVIEGLGAAGCAGVRAIVLDVEESPGQSGRYRIETES